MFKMNIVTLFFLEVSKYSAKIFLSDIKSEQKKLIDEIVEDLNGSEYPSGKLLEYFTVIEYFPYKYDSLKNSCKIKIINPGKSNILTLSIL
jgi:hypothetical protein